MKQFGGKTCSQIVPVMLGGATRFTDLQFVTLVHRARAIGAVHLSISIGLIFCLLLTPNLTASYATAKDAVQGVSSVDPSFAQTAQACGGVFGRVFTDLNHDDFQDPNEIGLPGVKLVTQNGLELTTDREGRFNSGCILVTGEHSQSKILLKLDPHSLPQDSFLKDEKFRETILNAGQFVNLDFGVSRARIVQLSLRSSAFENKTLNLKAPWLEGIDRLIEVLSIGPSVLRVTYFGTPPDLELAKKRTGFLKQLIEERRKKLKNNYNLPIEIRLISAYG